MYRLVLILLFITIDRNMLSAPNDDDVTFPGMQRALDDVRRLSVDSQQRLLATTEAECCMSRLTTAVKRATLALTDGAVL
jgi:hypothetical protein